MRRLIVLIAALAALPALADPSSSAGASRSVETGGSEKINREKSVSQDKSTGNKSSSSRSRETSRERSRESKEGQSAKQEQSRKRDFSVKLNAKRRRSSKRKSICRKSWGNPVVATPLYPPRAKFRGRLQSDGNGLRIIRLKAIIWLCTKSSITLTRTGTISISLGWTAFGIGSRRLRSSDGLPGSRSGCSATTSQYGMASVNFGSMLALVTGCITPLLAGW